MVLTVLALVSVFDALLIVAGIMCVVVACAMGYAQTIEKWVSLIILIRCGHILAISSGPIALTHVLALIPLFCTAVQKGIGVSLWTSCIGIS